MKLKGTYGRRLIPRLWSFFAKRDRPMQAVLDRIQQCIRFGVSPLSNIIWVTDHSIIVSTTHNGRPALEKYFSRHGAGRRAHKSEYIADAHFGGSDWKIPITHWTTSSYVMEQLPESSRLDRCVSDLTRQERLIVGCEILHAILEIYLGGYSHGDVKAQNVYVTAKGVRIGDFESLMIRAEGPFANTLDIAGSAQSRDIIRTRGAFGSLPGSIDNTLSISLSEMVDTLLDTIELNRISKWPLETRQECLRGLAGALADGWSPDNATNSAGTRSRVVAVSSGYPGKGGRSTVVDGLRQAFEGAGLEFHVVSMWPGTRRPPSDISVFTVLKPSWLHKGSLTGGQLNLKFLILLPAVAIKRLYLLYARYKLKSILYSHDHKTVVILMGIPEIEFVKTTAPRPRDDSTIFIGQYHNAYDTLNYFYPGITPQRVASAFDYCDALTTLSTEDAECFSTIVTTRSLQIDNCIPPRRLGDTVSEPNFSHTGRPYVAIAAARLVPEKRLDLLIQLFAGAMADVELRHWQLHIYGRGPELPRLQSVISDLCCESNVRLMGHSSNITAEMDGARLNLMTSLFEGFGMVVGEAAQSAVPTLTFASSPGVAQFASALHGFVVANDDEDAYIEELKNLLRDTPLLELRGNAARQSVEAYSPEGVLPQWLHLIRSVDNP